jgi:hypothetical protein
MLARERVFQQSVQLRPFISFATCQPIPSSDDVVGTYVFGRRVRLRILVFVMAFDQSQTDFLYLYAQQKTPM